MNCQVKKMVTEYIKSVEVIIKSNWKKGDKTARIKFPMGKEIGDIFYSKIIDYKTKIIKVKWAMKSIRIDDDP